MPRRLSRLRPAPRLGAATQPPGSSRAASCLPPPIPAHRARHRPQFPRLAHAQPGVLLVQPRRPVDPPPHRARPADPAAPPTTAPRNKRPDRRDSVATPPTETGPNDRKSASRPRVATRPIRAAKLPTTFEPRNCRPQAQATAPAPRDAPRFRVFRSSSGPVNETRRSGPSRPLSVRCPRRPAPLVAAENLPGYNRAHLQPRQPAATTGTGNQ